ncbi:MAG TPA: hemagglutinin [Archangium sp.]|uniref:adventurous gliding motility protein AgmC n=1 Tax=Archangium sp. TaxID=1872627 RepID=UPI002ED8AACC
MSPIAPSHVVVDPSSRVACSSLLGTLVLVLALAPVAARAEADVFGLGNNQHGNLSVRDPGIVINASTPLTAEAPAGASELRVADVAGFAAGELVLLLQMGSDTALPGAGETEVQVSLADSGAGRWELARLESVEPGVLRLTAPLVRRFPSVSQVVRVPEYSDVRVSTNGSLVAPPWNGRSGGVLAFLTSGTVFNQGSLVADGAGFRGGAAETGTSMMYGCEALNGPVGSGGPSGGGSRKGEGISSVGAGAPPSGYGRLGNGGGGGNCHDAGGGGGALVGKGGRGGNSAQQEDGGRAVGGHGGAALRFEEPRERLLLGGGGGAGHEGTAGGAGGGIIFIRAHEIQGPKPRGLITANGGSPVAATHGGGGGGGAGGSIHVRVERRLGCTLLQAQGGTGAYSDISPGGGGGGGQLFLQGQNGVDSACTLSTNAGLAGTSPAGNGGAEPVGDAAADFSGNTVIINQAFVVPAVSWVSPEAGEVISPLSPLQGKTAPGATVQVFVDGAPLGAPVVADEAGGFSVVIPGDITEAPHEARAWAEQLGVRGALSAPLGFTVGELALRVGCGAAPATAGGGLGVLGLALLAWGLGRRSRSRG